MSMTAGVRQRINKPRCYRCSAGGDTHPYPRADATEHQLNGSVAGGYEWLCADCAYEAEHGGAVMRVERPPRPVGPPQRERLFDI